jgi:hypothetical protein
MKVWILEGLTDVDGGYLPSERQIIGVYDSYEKLEKAMELEKKGWDDIDYDEYEVE